MTWFKVRVSGPTIQSTKLEIVSEPARERARRRAIVSQAPRFLYVAKRRTVQNASSSRHDRATNNSPFAARSAQPTSMQVAD